MRLAIAALTIAALSAAVVYGAPVDRSKHAHDVMFREVERGRALFEGFETSVPPAGWALDQTNVNDTWFQDCGDYGTAYEGSCYATCLYDAALGPQEEWLYFDHTIEPGDECLCFYAFANTYWAIDEEHYNLFVTIDGTVVWDYYNDNDGAVTWQWQRYCVDISGYSVGQTITVGLGYEGQDGAQGSFDALSIGECPEDLYPCCPFEQSCYALPLAAWGNNGTTAPCGAGPAPWNWATITGVPTIDCDGQSFQNAWATVTSGQYPASTGGALIFGPFDITAECDCMDLCHYYDTEEGFDGGNVKVSTDGGSSWELVYPHRGYDDVLDSTEYIAECVAGEEVFTGNSVGFITDCFNLSDYEGQEIEIGFFFGSDGSNQLRGWHLNRIELGDSSTPVRRTSWGAIKAMYR